MCYKNKIKSTLKICRPEHQAKETNMTNQPHPSSYKRKKLNAQNQ